VAVKDDTGESFIREVDDEYRREKLGNFWSRYGRWLLVGIGALLIGVAAYLYWRNMRAEQADARAAAFSTALGQVRGGGAVKADAALTELSKAPEPGYRALALLEQAGAAAASDPAKAARMYDAAAANSDLAQPFRDLALLKSTQLQFDRLTPAQTIARLRPLALPGNPWFGTAGELTALAHMRAGQPDLARPLLSALVKDESVPTSIRGRAQQLLSSIAVPAIGSATAPALSAALTPPAGAPVR